MQPRLPIEIILLIPSFLSGDKDKQALRKLCLTSSLFLHPSRTLLYNHLVLSFGPRYTESPLPGTRLLQLLQLSPGLSKYVKKLTISTIPGGQRWLGVDVTLPDALTRIGPNQITSFSLERISLDEWSSLRGATKSSIIDTCFSASLVDLTLCRAPFDLLKHCGPQLKRFEARGVELARNNNIEPPNSPPITLDSLCLNGYPFHKYIAHLLDPSSKIQLHALTKLEITSTSPADNTAASRILSHCRNTLETFIVQPYAIYSAPEVEVPDCPFLTTFELRIDARGRTYQRDRPGLHWSASFIDNIPASTSKKIENLSISLFFILFEPREVPGGEVESQGVSPLREIGGVITNSVSDDNIRRWAGLRKLEVEVRDYVPQPGNTQKIRNLVLDALNTSPRSNFAFCLTTVPLQVQT